MVRDLFLVLDCPKEKSRHEELILMMAMLVTFDFFSLEIHSNKDACLFNYFSIFAWMNKYPFKDLILFEDEDFIVINKPSGIASLEDRSFESSTNILEMARAYHAAAQLCHRLDKDTTGALAIAKNPEAYRLLSMQFEARTVRKTYHAVSDGIHDFKDKVVDIPILALAKGAVRIDRLKGKSAQTKVQTLKAYRFHTLVECQPLTGRMHQIRVHLSTIGAPIICDEQYGGKILFLSTIKRKYNLKKDTEELPLIKRIALHAFALQFVNKDDKPIYVEAPYPKDFNVLVKQLEKNA